MPGGQAGIKKKANKAPPAVTDAGTTALSKRIVNVICYIVVQDVNHSQPLSSKEVLHAKTQSLYETACKNVFEKKGFPFNSDAFQSTFNVSDVHPGQLTRSSGNKPLTAKRMWDIGMLERREMTKFMSDHFPFVKTIFQMKMSTAAVADPTPAVEVLAEEDDIASIGS